MDKATTAEFIEFILESLRLINRRFMGGYEPMDEFVNYYSESVTVISDKPREILRASKLYRNVIVSY